MKKQSPKSLIVALLECQLVICIVICPQTGTFGDYCPQVGTLGTAGLTFSIFFGQIKKISLVVLPPKLVCASAAPYFNHKINLER